VTSLVARDSDLVSTPADAVVVGVAQRGEALVLGPGAAALEDVIPGGLRAALASVGVTGAADEVTRFPSLGAISAKAVVAVGLGSAAEDDRYDLDVLRQAAGSAVRTVSKAGTILVAMVNADEADAASRVRAVAEGCLLGAYTFDRFRARSPKPQSVDEIVLLAPVTPEVETAVDQATVVAEAVALCRDLVNTPPSHLHPADLARVAVAEGERWGLRVDVLDEVALAVGGYGGLIGVGSGSTHPPRLIRIAYSGQSGEKRRSIHLVGKGITFDSGGISIKPAERMELMKSDMAGAAAVLATLVAVARLRPDVNVVGWMACAENMPSGTAIRPSDVLTIHGGRTVEVLNTDAEGRLVLADAIARACEENPDVVLDVATLTGTQVLALGQRTSAVMGNNPALLDEVLAAAGSVGEPLWPMPMPEYLRQQLRSEVADIKNLGERYGGMLSAGLFLREFVADGVAWAHLDIAGPAFNTGSGWGCTPAGGTGVMVRTFLELVHRAGSNQPD
jgi:leucyl aminopeptidase